MAAHTSSTTTDTGALLVESSGVAPTQVVTPSLAVADSSTSYPVPGGTPARLTVTKAVLPTATVPALAKPPGPVTR
jgi:hypothetical protein